MDEHCRKALQYLSGNAAETSSNGSCKIKNGDAAEVELLDSYSRAVTTVVDTVGPAVLMVSRKKSGVRNSTEHEGAGSGVIIAPDGYILTNNHVVQGADALSITKQDGATLDAVLIGTDPATDLAVIRANGSRSSLCGTRGFAKAESRPTGNRHRQPLRIQFHCIHRRGERSRPHPAEHGRATHREHYSAYRSPQPGQFRWSAGRFQGKGGRDKYSYNFHSAGNRLFRSRRHRCLGYLGNTCPRRSASRIPGDRSPATAAESPSGPIAQFTE